MLQVTAQKTDAVKREYYSKSRTQKADDIGNFEDLLNLMAADPDNANTAIGNKGEKVKRGRDQTPNDMSQEKIPSESTENTKAPESGTNSRETTAKTGSADDGTAKIQQGEEVRKEYLTNMMPMAASAFQQLGIGTGNIDSENLPADKTAVFQDGIEDVDPVNLPAVQQVALTDNGGFSAPNSVNVLKMSSESLYPSQTAASAASAKAADDSLFTEALPDIGQNGKASSPLQNDPLAAGSVYDADTAENAPQPGETIVREQTYSADINKVFQSNETEKQTVLSQNTQKGDEAANDHLKTGQAQILSDTVDGMHEISKISAAAEKNGTSTAEPKTKDDIFKDAVKITDTPLSDINEQAPSAGTEMIMTAGVFSGKENNITFAVSHADILNQVTDPIVTAAKGDNRKFTIELTPESLGKVTVEMKYVSGKLMMQISADNSDTAKALSEKVAELKSSLTTNNVDVLNIDIIDNKDAQASFGDMSKGFDHSDAQDSDIDKRRSGENKNIYNNALVDDDQAATAYYTANRLLNYLV